MFDGSMEERVRRSTRGFVEFPMRSVSASYAVIGTDKHILADSTSGNITITLPPVEQWVGQDLYITKLVAANTVTVDGNGANVVGAATYAMTAQWTTLILRGTSASGWILV